ncbi:MAG: 2-dehydro-3-deoxygalactonokinase [Alphaproteobacteria bacterium]|jgi:2-dehydro-3-deoxygalactonokinase|nr:2-dehydro-3-deoxygalactonokinase [Alphaproteobacteria bacterium]
MGKRIERIRMIVSASGSAILIAVDWGTTNRRGYLLDGNGEILDTRKDDLGLVKVTEGRFQEAFDNLAAPWMETHGPMPVILSGMVGASTGWTEAPYCDLPAGLDDLAAALVPAPSNHPIWIVPGVTTRDRMDVPDVIRGEEIQAIAAAGLEHNPLIVLPGTHSKWIQMREGRIVDFTTFMTGDLHTAILNHTVIAHLRVDDALGTGQAFADGVDIGCSHAGELTHLLFGARSRILFGELASEDVSDYLSGLLIGAEIAGVLAGFGSTVPAVKLVGSEHLCVLYRTALESRGANVSIVNTEAIGRTYIELAKRAGIVKD